MFAIQRFTALMELCESAQEVQKTSRSLLFDSMDIPDPKSFLRMLASLRRVTRKDASKGQLETAIWIWFHEEDQSVVYDPPSIHTRATAAKGVLTAVARDIKTDPPMVVKLIARQPK